MSVDKACLEAEHDSSTLGSARRGGLKALAKLWGQLRSTPPFDASSLSSPGAWHVPDRGVLTASAVRCLDKLADGGYVVASSAELACQLAVLKGSDDKTRIARLVAATKK